MADPTDITTSTDGVKGKYFQVDVPDYFPGGTTPGRESYLRMGYVKGATDTSQFGDWLWGYFKGFFDEGNASHVRDKTGTLARGPVWGSGDTPDNLLTNAGWRDHTDGNRISTTGGDKVEIVRGNYQLIVLGRVDPHTGANVHDASVSAATFDMSGGHVLSSDISPEAVARTEYKSTKFGDGTWKMTEVTEKGWVHEIFEGEFVEEFRGSRKTSVVGKIPASMPDLIVDAASTMTYQGNPDIVDATWANSITEYKGSSDSYIPSITSTTYATTTSETVNGTGVTSNVYVKTIDETIGKIDDRCVVTSTKFADTHDLQYGGKTELLLGGITSFTLAAALEVYVGAKLELFAGKKTEVTLGVDTSVKAGSSNECTFGTAFELNAATKTELTVVATTETSEIISKLAMAVFLG